MRAKFYAFDAAGQRTSPQASELLITENGIARPINSVQCPTATTLTLSSVLTIDASGSMNHGSGPSSNMVIAKAAAHVWIRSLGVGQSECAITSFDDVNSLHQDFTSDTLILNKAIDGLVAGAGTNYDQGLIDPASGALQVSKRGRYKKVVVFLTDGLSSTAKSAEIIAEAQKQLCLIYVVTLGMSCPTVLRNISKQTGGAWFENITTIAQAESIYRQIFQQAMGVGPCDLTWQAAPCADGLHTVALSYSSAIDSTVYSISDSLTNHLSFTPSKLFFHSKPLGSPYDTTVTVTANNGLFSVTDITSSNPAYSIVPKSFSLANGQSTVLTITYTPPDSGFTWTTFNFINNLCSSTFQPSAGYPGKAAQTPTLKLETPNGGEQWVVGTEALITWSGIPTTDNVKLDYSIDSGKTWQLVVALATGGEYMWTVPNTPSVQCLVRSTLLQFGSDSSDLVYTLFANGKQTYRAGWSPNGALVATVSENGLLKIWDAITGNLIHSLSSRAVGLFRLDWSPDGRRVAVAGWLNTDYDGYAAVWDALSGAFEYELPQGSVIGRIAWSPDGKLLATTANQGGIWNATDGSLLHTLGNSNQEDLTWNPSSTQVAAGGTPGAHVWDASSGNKIYTLIGHGSDGWNVRWSPDGSRIATGARKDKLVEIWDAATGALQLYSSPVTDEIRMVEWSSDGRRLLAYTIYDCAMIWDAANGSLLTRFDCGGVIWAACWSPDGRFVATGSIGGRVDVWDSHSGEIVHRFVGHASAITSLEFSPDGRFLLSSSYDETAKIWRMQDTPIMMDVSDAVFAIVAPAPDAMNVDMGRVVTGGSKDSVVTAFVRNSGTFAFNVDSITIAGADASAFGVVSGFGSFTISSGASTNVEFHFAPTMVRTYAAQILVHTAGGMLTRAIVGEGVPPTLEIVDGIVDFGRVVIGTTQSLTQVATVRNIGPAPITITLVRQIGPNVVDFTSPVIGQSFTLTPGGSTQLVDMSFAPTYKGRTSNKLLFDFDGVGSPAVVTLFGEGIKDPTLESATTGLRVGSATARVNDVVDIPITLVLDSNLANTSATSFTGQLRFNSTLLEPLSPLALGTLSGNDRIIDVALPLPPDTNGVLTTLQFRAALGNDSLTPLILENVQTVGGNVVVTTEPGEFRLEGICYAGGARLLNPNSSISLSNAWPNPIIYGFTEVTIETTEAGKTSLVLRDIVGRTVKSFINGEVESGIQAQMLDVGDVAAGAYLLTLRTPTEQRTIRIEIAP